MEKQSIVLANWIKNAELINRAALCKQVGLDRANLDKYLQRGEIPEKFIADLGKALYDYGYKASIEKRVAENNKPENKKKIEQERNTQNESSQDAKNTAIISDMEKQFQELINKKQNGNKKS